MKNIIKPIVCFTALTIMLTSCFNNKDFDISKKTPNSKFICTYLENGTVIADNATITTEDKVVFSSEGKYGDCGTNFALYTGIPGNKFEPNYQMYNPNNPNTDSIQNARSKGVLLDTLGGKFVSTAVKYSEPGTYTVYMVASFVNKQTGEYKSDSTKMTLNVIDPSVSNAKLTFVQILDGKARSAGIARITNDSICFDNVLPANVTRFKNSSIKFNPTNVSLTYKGQPLTELSTIAELVNGDVITTTSKDGSASASYKVGIYIFKSKSAVASAATFKNVASETYTFSDDAVISDDSIKLAPWPKGTTKCDVTVKVPYATDKTVSISSFPSNFVTTAQDGVTTKTYKVYAPKTELDAAISGISLVTTNSYVMKPVTGGYSCVVTNVADLNAKFKIDTKKFATIQYDTLSNYTTVKPYTSSTTAVNFAKYDTIYFQVKNGTDVNKFFVKLYELK